MSARADGRALPTITFPTDATVHSDPALLAPRFRAAVDAALAACHAVMLPVEIAETYRTSAKQAAYYAQGRTSPGAIITHAATNLRSWHGYGLAVDVCHASSGWDVPDAWWAAVAVHFEAHGLTWGGRWRMRDQPHFQWGRCRASPSARARALIAEGGLARVWEEVGAI